MKGIAFCGLFAGLATLSIAAISSGLAMLHQAVPRALSEAESRTVLGGAAGVNLASANCAASSVVCTAIQCPAPTYTCPANMAQFTQTAPTYPSGTVSPGGLANAPAQQYICRTFQYCSNPCSQSTMYPYPWYCGGPVGQTFNDTPVNGVKAGPPNPTEA